MNVLRAALFAALAALPGFILAWWATVHSQYGYLLFVGSPVLMGFLAVLFYTHNGPKRLRNCMGVSLSPLLVYAAMLLVWRIEGLICLAMASPLAIPPALFGGYLAYRSRKAAVAIALIPFTVFASHAGPAPGEFKVSTSISIDAAPDRVWQSITAFPDLRPPDELIFRAGVAAPMGTAIHGSGVGSARECVLTTGTMHERVTVWDPPRLLRFEVLSTPPAMKEMNPFGDIDPPHLHGYYTSRQGQFELTPLPGGGTLVTGTSWYRHGLEPAQYWRIWSDYVVHKVHRRVLTHIKALAEAQR